MEEEEDDDDYESEEDKEEEEEMDLDMLRRIRRFSAMSLEGQSSDESHSPPRMSSLQLQVLQPQAPESQEMESGEFEAGELDSQMLELGVSEGRSRPRGLGIHSSGRKIIKSRSRSRSPTKKGGVLKQQSPEKK